MSLFSSDKEKAPEQGSLLVLAYLEDALLVKSPFFLKEASQNEIAAAIHSVNEEAGTFRLMYGGELAANKGEKIEFILIHEGLRLGATSQVMEVRIGVVVLQLPENLELKERRRSPRARLNPKEGASVSAFQELMEGVGLSGSLENLSEYGFKIRVEKAIAISTEKHLVLGTTLVSPGQSFAIVRLNKIPKCPPVLEMTGKASHIAYEQGGLTMGFAFGKLPEDISGILHGFIASRTAPIPSTLPPKARRPKKKEEEEAAVETPITDSPATPAPVVSELPGAIVPKPGLSPSLKAPQVQDKSAALLRLKKMSRATIIYSPDHQSGILTRFLSQHGFGRILVAPTMETLLDSLLQPSLGVLFIDWDGSPEEAIELTKLLSNAFENLPPVVLAIRQITENLVIVAGEAGFSHIMRKPYACDEALASLLDQQFLQHVEPEKG